MKRKLRILSILTVVTLLFSSVTAYATAPQSIDAFLLDAGFPQAIIDEMSTPQKELIYEQSAGLNVEFCGYEKKEFTLADDGMLVEAGNGARGGLIPSSDLTLTVCGVRVFQTSDNSVFYIVYPGFTWHTYKAVANDSFAMNMYPGWSAIPGEQNFRLHWLNSNGQSVQYIDFAPSNSASTGYVYKIPSDTGTTLSLYEGAAYFHVDKTLSTAYPAISLYYAHDTSPGYEITYSLDLEYGSISIAGTIDPIYTMSGNFRVEGLAQ